MKELKPFKQNTLLIRPSQRRRCNCKCIKTWRNYIEFQWFYFSFLYFRQKSCANIAQYVKSISESFYCFENALFTKVSFSFVVLFAVTLWNAPHWTPLPPTFGHLWIYFCCVDRMSKSLIFSFDRKWIWLSACQYRILRNVWHFHL